MSHHWLPIETRITYKLVQLRCMRLCMMLRRSTSETCRLLWLNCLVARTFVLLHLGYTRCHAHERNLGPESFSAAQPTAWECSTTRAVRNRWLVCFRKKNWKLYFSSRFMVLTLIHANQNWSWFWYWTYCKAPLRRITKSSISNRWPCMKAASINAWIELNWIWEI